MLVAIVEYEYLAFFPSYCLSSYLEKRALRRRKCHVTSESEVAGPIVRLDVSFRLHYGIEAIREGNSKE